MAAAASNKSTSNKEMRIPELEERAFQYILDSCESSISKYTKFLQVINSVPKYKWLNHKYGSNGFNGSIIFETYFFINNRVDYINDPCSLLCISEYKTFCGFGSNFQF